VKTVTTLHGTDVQLVGLGKAEEFTLDRARQAAGSAATRARSLGCKSIATMDFGAGAGQLDPQASAQATVEGVLLGLYEFRDHKSTPAERGPIESLTLVEADPARVAAVEAGARAGRILAEATNLTRDLVNQPSNHMTPHILADTARVMASQNGLQCQVLSLEQMAELRMGALMGVTRGSDEPPQFIILEHKPDAGQPVIFVGKGITFDSGGISIKPSEHMEEMKSDMAGAATVIGAMQAVAQLICRCNRFGPGVRESSSGCHKPGDAQSNERQTIEIISTGCRRPPDPGDALRYAARYNPPL
jgi:leucyl aminopeptidase